MSRFHILKGLDPYEESIKDLIHKKNYKNIIDVSRDSEIMEIVDKMYGNGRKNFYPEGMSRICSQCGKESESVKIRRQNTMYEDVRSNYVVLCPGCFEENEEYWRDQWVEYWSEVI